MASDGEAAKNENLTAKGRHNVQETVGRAM
jgi:hypothetical protein